MEMVDLMNFDLATEQDEQQEMVIDLTDNDVNSKHDGVNLPIDLLNDDTDARNRNNKLPQKRQHLATICVVLSGPFTRQQKEIGKRKVAVDWNKIINALEWLKAKNPLYRDLVYHEHKVGKM
jgi:hypothetical protein